MVSVSDKKHLWEYCDNMTHSPKLSPINQTVLESLYLDQCHSAVQTVRHPASAVQAACSSGNPAQPFGTSRGTFAAHMHLKATGKSGEAQSCFQRCVLCEFQV